MKNKIKNLFFLCLFLSGCELNFGGGNNNSNNKHSTNIIVDRYNEAGWQDTSRWTYIAKNLVGDYSVVTTYTFETNGVEGNWWKGVMSIIQHDLGEDKKGSTWVNRMDWWGWCDQFDSEDKLTHDWDDLVSNSEVRDYQWSDVDGNDVTFEQFETALTKSDVVWTSTRVGTEITNTYIITSQTGEVFTYWTKATDVALEKNINLILTCEYAKYKVTSIKKDNDNLEDMCKDGHTYSTKVTKEVTCSSDGEVEKTCIYCKDKQIETIPADGIHRYEIELERVPSTCITEGYVINKCTGCDLEEKSTLSLDYTDHEGEIVDGEWNCCHQKPETDRYYVGGWEEPQTWTYLAMNLEGDFEVATTFNFQTNGIKGNWWRGVLPIVQHSIEGNNLNGSVWVNRLDWWGWCDQWASDDKLTQDWNHEGDIHKNLLNRDSNWTTAEGKDVSSDQFEAAMTNSDVEWKCSRKGTVIINNFTIYSHTGEIFTYWSKATDVALEKDINLALTCEFAKYQIKSIVNGDNSDEDMCKDGHTYSTRTIKEATCSSDGQIEKSCIYCDDNQIETIPADGIHRYEIELERVPSTCLTEGYVINKCTGCDLEEKSTLSLDYTNHEGEIVDGEWNCCHQKTEVDRYNLAGWGEPQTWTYLAMNLKGDFEVTTNIHLEVNTQQDLDNFWEGLLPIVQHSLDENNLNGSPWVTRLDWYGWCDQWVSEDKLTQDWNHEGDIHKNLLNRDSNWTTAEGKDASSDQFEAAMTNSDVEWKCSRKGTVIINNFTIYSHTGEIFTYWTKATDVALEKDINLALTCEFARYSVYSVDIQN